MFSRASGEETQIFAKARSPFESFVPPDRNNRTEQSHGPIKQRYYPMLGFKNFESAGRFCTAFNELRNYLRIESDSNDPGSAVVDRTQFIARWNTLVNELAAYVRST